METLAYFISKARCLSNAKAESITDESLESNCSIIENISPKGVSFYILLLALPCLYSLIHILICNTEIDKNLKHGNKIRKDMVG